MKKQSDSLNRRALYTFLAKHTLDGSIVDLGGSLNASYHPSLQGNNTFTVVNIDTNYGYDIYANLEQPLPMHNEQFDHALLLNVLEHIYSYTQLVAETYRVMKPGGTVLHLTPFLVQEHGCPYDYFRYTPQSLRQIYEEAGFTVQSIEPVCAGVFTTVYETSNFFVPTRFLRSMYRIAMCSIEKHMRRFVPRYAAIADKFALSYTLVAVKEGGVRM
jgi:SAM-dependent methyltransferase